MDEIKVKNSGYVTLKRYVDDRDGALCIMNAQQEIPFDIKRVYYINNLENMTSIRGKHAHKQLRQDILMMKDNVGVILGPMLWHTMHKFSSGCVLLVVASDYYDESDYIRNYDEFIAEIKRMS